MLSHNVLLSHPPFVILTHNYRYFILSSDSRLPKQIEFLCLWWMSWSSYFKTTVSYLSCCSGGGNRVYRILWSGLTDIQSTLTIVIRRTVHNAKKKSFWRMCNLYMRLIGIINGNHGIFMKKLTELERNFVNHVKRHEEYVKPHKNSKCLHLGNSRRWGYKKSCHYRKATGVNNGFVTATTE